MSNAKCTKVLAPVPYFSQWESRDLTGDVLSKGAEVALARDPRWASSGAGTLGEYVTWGAHVCGMACLKMTLAARTGRIIPTLELARECTANGGYVVDVNTGRIQGLIYAPFVRFVRERFGVDSEVITGTTAERMPQLFDHAEFFLASVHPSIRWRIGSHRREAGIRCWSCSALPAVWYFTIRPAMIRHHSNMPDWT